MNNFIGLNFRKYLSQVSFIFFILIIFFILERSLYSLYAENTLLTKQMTQLKQEISQAKKRQMLLSEEVNSQSDPAWIELVLKKELGLIPEGQTKIIFRE